MKYEIGQIVQLNWPRYIVGTGRIIQTNQINNSIYVELINFTVNTWPENPKISLPRKYVSPARTTNLSLI